MSTSCLGKTDTDCRFRLRDGTLPQVLSRKYECINILFEPFSKQVGVGTKSRSALAQVCLVNVHEEIIYLKYVQTIEGVTDYRTHVSGITPKNLKKGSDFSTVQKEVAEILEGRILVGHGLNSDFKALMLNHPKRMIRDTAKYPPLMRETRTGKLKPRKLKTLAKYITGQSIQTGEHNPAEDAIAALRIYKHVKRPWELSLQKKSKPPVVPELAPLQTSAKSKDRKPSKKRKAGGAPISDNASQLKRRKKSHSNVETINTEKLLQQGMQWIHQKS